MYHLRNGVIYLGHKNKKSLIRQVEEKLVGMMAAGESRHLDKASGVTREKIYSYGTLDSYLQQCCAFVKFVKSEHKVKTLDDCKPFINDYIQKCINQGKSSYTIKLISSSLAKLYNCSSKEFISTPARKRENITRSRSAAVRDTHFSETKNKALVDFCCSTGLRRHELTALTGDCLCQDENGNYHIWVKQGKGGRSRLVPVVGNKKQIQNVVSLCRQAENEKVFPVVHNAADIHFYRGCYAERVYKSNARPIDSLQSSEKYYCRGTQKGIIYDREALRRTSQALGHNRVSIVAEHYLYSMK